MIRKLRNLLTHKAARNIGALVSGALAAQLVAMLVTPLLTRLYGPSDFGALSMLTSAASVIGVAATGRYEVGVTIVQTRREALQLALVAGSLAAIVTLLLLLYALSATLLGLPEVGSFHHGFWAFFLALQVGCAALSSIGSYWFTRQRDGSRQGLSQVLRSSSIAGFSIGFGLAKFNWGLIAGQVVGQAVAMLALVIPFLRREAKRLRVLYKPRSLIVIARKHVAYPRFTALQGVVSSLADTAMIWGLAVTFGSSEAGQYSLAYRICRLPLTIIGQAVRMALFKDLADAYHEGRAFKLAVRSTVALLSVGAIPLIALAIWGEPLFFLVFGAEWEMAGTYSRILTPWLLVAFANIPAITLIPIAGMQRFHLRFEIVFVTARVIGLGIGILTGSATTTLAIYSLLGFAFNLYLIPRVLLSAVGRQDARA